MRQGARSMRRPRNLSRSSVASSAQCASSTTSNVGRRFAAVPSSTASNNARPAAIRAQQPTKSHFRRARDVIQWREGMRRLERVAGAPPQLRFAALFRQRAGAGWSCRCRLRRRSGACARCRPRRERRARFRVAAGRRRVQLVPSVAAVSAPWSVGRECTRCRKRRLDPVFTAHTAENGHATDRFESQSPSAPAARPLRSRRSSTQCSHRSSRRDTARCYHRGS